MKAPYRTILCPTDLSPLGNLAVPVAYMVADRGATVHLIHVDAPVHTGNPLYPDERPKDAPTASQVEAAKKDRKAKLSALVPASAASCGIKTVVDLVEGEDVAVMIESEARRRGSEVIVLGSHGRWGLARIVHGESMALRLLHKPDLDVVIVHSDRP